MTQSSKHRTPFKPRRQGSKPHLTGFSSRQGSRFIYTYDSMGRMLTRDDGTDLTTFTWDHWDCIKEVTGESETVYHVPEGQILSFIRNGERYELHADALGSVRMVTDDNGDVVFRRHYDAWGSELPGGFDSVPGGMPYGFVGAYGCRKDPATSLVYMRQRWYDPTLQRFISRDPVYRTKLPKPPSDGLVNPEILGPKRAWDTLPDFSTVAPSALMMAASKPYAYVSNKPQQGGDPYGLIGPVIIGFGILGAWAIWQSACAVYAHDSAVEWDVRSKNAKPGCYGNNKDRIQHCIASCLHNKCTGLFQSIITMSGGIGWEILGGNFSAGDVIADAFGAAKGFDLLTSCETNCTEGYLNRTYGTEAE